MGPPARRYPCVLGQGGDASIRNNQLGGGVKDPYPQPCGVHRPGQQPAALLLSGLYHESGVMRGSWLVSLLLAACLGLSGTVGATTLSEQQMPRHGHAIILTTTGQNGTVGVYGLSASTEAGRSSSRIITTGNSQPHTHSLTASTAAAGSLPPYYALAYIMRIA